MIETRAVVTRSEGEDAYVEVNESAGGCGHCDEAGGCRSSLLGDAFGAQRRVFRIANTLHVVAGQSVVIGTEDYATLRAAVLAYGVPLVLLLTGAGLGTAIAPAVHADLAAAGGALAGLLGGFALARFLPLRSARIRQCRPVMLRKYSSVTVEDERP
ncbi:MAG: SoxR reducing system RseC family protein [Pseudomonadota bacterium]|jgi:sigma-E factor negative regulatory protein RseC